jgi:mannose-6-phosphate isomerase-like protein (cupin superfamily)
MKPYHHRKLPKYSTLLSGHRPHDENSFQSQQLQIWYNNTDQTWSDEMPHMHAESDEIFVVLQGALTIEVADERFRVGPREFCCFPRGVYHSVVEVHPPVETLMIRAPSVDDKVYQGQ